MANHHLIWFAKTQKRNRVYTAGTQTLETFRKVAQPDDPNLLHALGMLAHAYMHTGQYSAALPLLTEQLETLR